MEVKVPREHRHNIISSYIRYRELAQVEASVLNKAEWANAAFWIGIGLFLIWLVNLATVSYDPGFLAGSAFTLFMIGLVTRADALKTKSKHYDQKHIIESDMEAIGVQIKRPMTGGVSVYYGQDSEECRFNPLSDHSYSPMNID